MVKSARGTLPVVDIRMISTCCARIATVNVARALHYVRCDSMRRARNTGGVQRNIILVGRRI
jgi:hypothetical protein